MKKWGWMSLIVALNCQAAVTVTNLVVSQRPGTKLMDITYDVSNTAAITATISLTVSNGASRVNATNLTGSVGARVSIGTGKSIVWNMGTDWNGNVNDLSFTVLADDGICAIAKTGQTVSYRTGDDGDLEPGVEWPNPRFTDLGDGTVKDNLTGLEWVKTPHSLAGNSSYTNWNSAIDFCNNLVYAGHSDWRLPSRKELMSLVDYGPYSPALPTGHPFSNSYWSSTSVANDTLSAWYVKMYWGVVSFDYKTYNLYVWPVRGGQ